MRGTPSTIAAFEDGKGRHQARNAGGLNKNWETGPLERAFSLQPARKWALQFYSHEDLNSVHSLTKQGYLSPQAASERDVALWARWFYSMRPRSDFGPLKLCSDKLCCFKPLDLWQLVTEAVGN